MRILAVRWEYQRRPNGEIATHAGKIGMLRNFCSISLKIEYSLCEINRGPARHPDSAGDRTHSQEQVMKVTFAGLGVMGYPMAGFLARAGHDVTVFKIGRAHV